MPYLSPFRSRLLSLRLGLRCESSRASPGPATLRHWPRNANRSFTHISSLRAARPAPAPKHPKPSPATIAETTQRTARPALRPYLEVLASKGTPTLLYEAPSHFWLRFSCFSGAAFCVSYTTFQYWNVYINPPEGLSWWVPHAFGLVLVFMAGMGAWFATNAGGIVRRILAVPTVTAPSGLGTTARTSSMAAAPLAIEVATTRPFPFLPEKRTRVAPTEVKIPFRVAALMAEQRGFTKQPSPTERLQGLRAERERRREARKYEMDHLMTAPFRHAGSAIGAAFTGLRRGLNREGFAKIKVNGIQYKFDVTGGWALDEGKALDRVLHVRPGGSL